MFFVGLVAVGIGVAADLFSLLLYVRLVVRGHGPSGLLGLPILPYILGAFLLSNAAPPETPLNRFLVLGALVGFHLVVQFAVPFLLHRFVGRNRP